ncbi:MAG: hypothetical protein JRE71_03215 [Deltaproteobacteria bacterium]|nr:hypothetical protein [Deltaproteobacteria bacterium]
MASQTSGFKKLLFGLFTVVLVLGVLEIAARAAFPWIFPKGEFSIRMLQGEAQIVYQRAIGQSYLNYVSAPNFENEFGIQHNAHGYRGPLVEVAKPPDTLRILCLGGSTTYGWGVDRPDQTYPAHLQQALAANLPGKFRNVEVINGGLPWGTSAELLTHYHFKYHYYQPDWVVIHSGLNDAQAFDAPYYQPDYDHFRRQMPGPTALPERARWLTHSRLVDLFLILLLVEPHPEEASFNKALSEPADIPWFEKERPDRAEPKRISPGKIAYVHNIETLVDQIQNDGGQVVLMPVAWHPGIAQDKSNWDSIYRQTGNSVRYTLVFEGLLKEIARERGATYVRFPVEQMNQSNWADAMHLDSDGSRKKAEYVASFIRSAIERDSAPNP